MAGYLPAERLRRKLDIYASEDERQRIAHRAARTGLSVSCFVRKAAMGAPLREVPSVNAAHWAELGRLAANLNQVARALNMGSTRTVDERLLRQLLEQVRLLRLDLTGGESDR